MHSFSLSVNRAARISAVADGGHISASQDVVDILQDVVMEHKPSPSSLDSDNGEEVSLPSFSVRKTAELTSSFVLLLCSG
jgi:class 3 adenylate cyclase